MNLQLIRAGLATKMGNLTLDPSVFSNGPQSRVGHNIRVVPASEYIVPETIGAVKDFGLMFDIVVEVPGRLDDSQIAMDEYLSTGTGATSSVIDAVLLDGTQGGTVDATYLIGVDGPDLNADPLTAVLHFRFMVSRG